MTPVRNHRSSEVTLRAKQFYYAYNIFKPPLPATAVSPERGLCCCRFTVYCCSHCVCRLCIFLGVDCVVVVSLFIDAPIVYVGCVFSWAVIVLLLFPCLLLLPLCV